MNNRTISEITPPPGSDKALSHGCRCPVLDNEHGKGLGGDGEKYGWCINQDCPLHGQGKEVTCKN